MMGNESPAPTYWSMVKKPVIYGAIALALLLGAGITAAVVSGGSHGAPTCASSATACGERLRGGVGDNTVTAGQQLLQQEHYQRELLRCQIEAQQSVMLGRACLASISAP